MSLPITPTRLLLLPALYLAVACGSDTPDPTPDAGDATSDSGDATSDSGAGEVQPVEPERTPVDPADLVGYRASLYPTHVPTERKNLNGTNTLRNVGLPRAARLEELEIDMFEMPYPTAMYTREPDEIFVFGGTPIFIEDIVARIDGLPAGDNETAPYFAKFNPITEEIVYVALDRGAMTLPYLGGALIHADGFVYVVAQAHLYKIEPASMAIVASVALPTANQSTIYNGIITGRTGELIAKGFTLDTGESSLLLIDGDTMQVTFELECEECATARMALELDENGVEHLYHLNEEQTFRFVVERGSLTLDESWVVGIDPYGTGQRDEPTSPVVMNGRVYYTTNTRHTTSTQPMRAFWQEVNATYTPDMPPLAGSLMFEDPEDMVGWSFSGLAADEDGGVLLGNDQGRGLVNAFVVNDDGTLSILWQKDATVSASGAVVADREVVYVTDYVDGSNHLVVLDLMTGNELLRIPTPATRATIGSILLTPDNEVFLASNEPGQPTGLLVRVRVADAE